MPEKVPEEQGRQSSAFAAATAAWSPAGHRLHALAASSYWPAGHALEQLAEPWEEKLPCAQLEHAVAPAGEYAFTPQLEQLAEPTWS